jgi:hypothetical protein
MKRVLAAFAVTCLWLGMEARAQDDLAISGKIEIWSDWSTTDAAGVETKTRAQDIDMDLKFKWTPVENVTGRVKLDVEDTAAAGDLLEEAYVTVSHVGSPDSPLDITFGKKELKFGQDKSLWEADTMVHDWAEVDNALALEFGVRLGERAKVYVTNWQQSDLPYVLPSGDEEPVDNFLFQSHALKGEIKLADGLALNLSYLNRHDEGKTAPGASQDEKRFSVGVNYENKDLGLKAFAEYVGVTDANFDEGEDGSVLGVGLKYAIGMERKLEVGLKYEISAFEDAGVDTVDESVVVLGFAYNVAKGASVVAEYISGSDDVANSDARGMTMGFICKF